MTFEETWVPKIKAYRFLLDAELEPYKKFTKDMDITTEHFNAMAAMETVLTDREKLITTTKAKALLAKQLSAEWSAVEIFDAFAKRGALSQIFTNCAMQIFIQEGRDRAAELDKYRVDNGQLIGPFHGLPFSIKEHLKFAGKVTTASYVCYLDNVIGNSPREESVNIQIIRKLGGVFYIRTSQPQAIMHMDTDNVITGRTTSPFNRKLSPGGSSGGEGAAVALGASVIGIGSDIGGSIRAPSAFCNLYGIRCTTKRISGLGSLSGGAGQESIFATQGPMTNSIEDLEYFMENYINVGKPWDYDPNVVPVEWRKAELSESVTFGILMTDTMVTPSDAITRGLNYVREKLEGYKGKKINVKVINIDHDLMVEAFSQVCRIFGSSKPVHEKLFEASGEPILPLTQFFLDCNKPDNNVLKNNVIKEKFKFYMHYLFIDEGIDFLISPCNTNVADLQSQLTYWNYTCMWNLIDFPNVVFRTGLTYDPSVDIKGPSNNADFHTEDYVNAPIAFQLTGLRFMDEKVVEGVKLLDAVLGV